MGEDLILACVVLGYKYLTLNREQLGTLSMMMEETDNDKFSYAKIFVTIDLSNTFHP